MGVPSSVLVSVSLSSLVNMGVFSRSRLIFGHWFGNIITSPTVLGADATQVAACRYKDFSFISDCDLPHGY
jgi:hypothetical protein